ncbi:FeoA family protein [Petrotoga sp. 9PWA.NaAc.5.4]|uniref:FeoA family protein n=1 Tax=Petrotoga sp. 9PWA.NaAc.5.4 TaxID=1434328 RepID=UPI000EFB5A3C|nr:FeoA family protein [Petrotoga sp. 9PWA.NaAc.5.4]
MIIPLSKLFIGQKGKIHKLSLKSEDLNNRFISMGMIPGKMIELVHISPFGDPLVFKTGERKLVLRKSEAANIFVEVEYIIENLFEIESGDYEVIHLEGGRTFYKEMKKMGILEGIKIKKVNKYGNKISVEIKGDTFEIGRGKAEKIFCKKVA